MSQEIRRRVLSNGDDKATSLLNGDDNELNRGQVNDADDAIQPRLGLPRNAKFVSLRTTFVVIILFFAPIVFYQYHISKGIE